MGRCWGNLRGIGYGGMIGKLVMMQTFRAGAQAKYVLTIPHPPSRPPLANVCRLPPPRQKDLGS